MKQSSIVLLALLGLASVLVWAGMSSFAETRERAGRSTRTTLERGAQQGRAPRARPARDGAPHALSAPDAAAGATPGRAAQRDLSGAASDAPCDAGPCLQGTVRSGDGPPLAAATLDVGLAFGSAVVPIARTTTAGDGSYALGLAEALAGHTARAPFELVVTAGGAGHQPSSLRRTHAGDAAPLVVDFVLEPGGELAARVVDAARTPLAGVAVALVVRSQTPGGTRPNVVRTTQSQADGGFRLGFLSSGRYELHARLAGVGSALVTDLALEAGEEVLLDDLVLRGPGVLAGRVTFQGGSPIADLELWAVPEDLATLKSAVARARTSALEREQGLGLGSASTRTAPDGSFRITGLAPGRYALLSEDQHTELVPERAVFATDGEPIELVARTQRLRVSVRDQHGQPFAGASVAVTEMRREPDGTLVPGPTRRADADATGSAAFDVPPLVPLAVRVRGRGHHVVDELVELAAGEDERALELFLIGEGSGGHLRLDVRTQDGAPAAGYRVWVLAHESGLALPGCDGTVPGEGGALGPLPPGRYGVVVWPRDGAQRGLDLPAQSEAPVEVVDGRDTLVSLTLPRGARLSLTLAVPPGDEPVDVLPEEGSTWGEITLRRRAQRHLRTHGAEVRLVDARGDERLLNFQLDGASGLEVLMLPGTSAPVHDLLAPGTYALRIAAPAFAPLELPLTLQAGETAEVVAALAPLPAAR